MKRAIVTGYTFTPATKTLDFSSISGFNARSLVGVVNVTQKVMIYGVGITGKGYTSLTGGNVFVLQYDTTSHSSGDILYIIYDDITGDATNGLDVDVTRMAALVAGSAIIGKVGIDQTTPGTTNAVAATNLPTTVDTNSGNKSASTLRVVLATDQPTMSNAQPVTPAATEVHLGQVGGTSLIATGTMTRPSDTTAYAAGDGVTTATSSASAMSVTSAARTSAGSGLILGGFAEKSTTSTTNAQFRIWVYQDTPSAIPNDNAAFTAATHADYQKIVATATFDFASGITGSDGVRVPITLDAPNGAAFKLASGTSLTVIWEARAAYTPGNAEVFRLGLYILQD